MPPTATAGGAFVTGDNAGNDLMATAARLGVLGFADFSAFSRMPRTVSILNMERLLKGGKLRCDRDGTNATVRHCNVNNTQVTGFFKMYASAREGAGGAGERVGGWREGGQERDGWGMRGRLRALPEVQG